LRIAEGGLACSAAAGTAAPLGDLRRAHLAARLAGRVPAGHNTRPASWAAKWASWLLPFVTTLALAAAALAQGIDVTATLDITNGLARPGAYVPVRLKVTNGTDAWLTEIRVRNNGPVEVRLPWLIGPGKTDEGRVPVFYTGGDLELDVSFAARGSAEPIRAAVASPKVQAIDPGTALAAIDPSMPDPDEALRQKICKLLGVKSLQLVHIPKDAWAGGWQDGLIDAALTDFSPLAPPGFLLIDVRSPDPLIDHRPFPSGVRESVQPDAYRLLGQEVWPGAERQRLWIGLGVFSLAVLTVGVLASRRRPRLAVGSFIVLASVATCLIWCFGDVCLARTREARVFYVDVQFLGHLCEHFVQMESRGGKTVLYACGELGPLPGDTTSVLGYTHRGVVGLPQKAPPVMVGGALPIPVLASSQDLFRSQCTLAPERDVKGGPTSVWRFLDFPPFTWVPSIQVELAVDNMLCGTTTAVIRSNEPQLLLHNLTKTSWPFEYAPAKWEMTELPRQLTERSDLVAALLVEGDRGKDAAGRTQSLDAWAVEWQASKDPDVAFAGRSLAWWKKDRQEGEGPWILSWWHDPLPAGEASENHERLPALVVDSSASKQP
jgi:hypothetical protein